jgi:hypothetical protein
MLDKMDMANVSAGAELWEKVVRKLRSGAMPPVGRPRPDEATYGALTASLEAELDRAAAAKPNPGRVASFHRLNRTEYQNTIHDLLALEVDGAWLLPADDVAYGFDNIADVLSVSSALLDRYLSAANKISRLAIGDPRIRPGSDKYRMSKLLVQEARMSEDLPFGSRGGVAIRHYFPLDAEYAINIRVQGYSNPPQSIEVRLDGVRVAELMTGGQPGNESDAPDVGAVEARFAAKAGAHLIGVAFVQRTIAVETRFPAILPWGNSAVSSSTNGASRYLRVNTVDISGPFNAHGPGDTPSRRRVFVCQPTTRQDERPCAATILSTLSEVLRPAFGSP